jgi:hypothetical protein
MSRCAVLVTDRQLLPIVTGNRVRILGILAALRALGWRVVLVARPDVAPLAELRRRVDGFVAVTGRAFAGGDVDAFDPGPFRRAVERAVRTHGASIVIAQYVWLAPALAHVPRFVRRVIDCHDLFYERTERFRAAGLHPWAICTREQERRRLEHGDVILATQEREAAALRELLPRRRVACILTPIPLPAGFARRPSAGGIVLAVGANHPGNEAIVEFAVDCWPRVVAAVPDARLRVVGGIGARLGAIPNVAPHYAEAAVVACPVTLGTGVKTKLLEALRFGKAAVVTPAGLEGMPAPSRTAWVAAPSLPACADSIVALLEDAPLRARLESAAFEFGERHLADRPFRDRIGRLLPNALQRGLATMLS